MLSMGLHVTGAQILARIREPRILAAAVAINLVALPVIVWALSLVLALPEGTAGGLMVTAVAAGGSLGPKLVEISSGDVPFAIGLMFILDVLAAVLVAPVSSVLLGSGPNGIRIDPWPVLLSVTMFQALPLVGGLMIARLRPGAARTMRRPMVRASSVLLVIASLVILVDSIDEVFAVGPVTIAVMVITVTAAQ